MGLQMYKILYFVKRFSHSLSIFGIVKYSKHNTRTFLIEDMLESNEHLKNNYALIKRTASIKYFFENSKLRPNCCFYILNATKISFRDIVSLKLQA